MSTVDPREARARKHQQAIASGAMARSVVVLAIVHATLWASAAFGIAEILDLMLSDARSPDEPDWTLVLFFIGVFGGAVVGFTLTKRAAALLPLPAAFSLPYATAAAGVTVGFTVRWGELRLPSYIAAGIAILLILLVARLASAGRAKQRRLERIVATGTRVDGDLSEVTFTGTEVMGSPMIEFTVHYRDANGVERWATKRSVFPPASVPAVGRPVTIRYDPAVPDDESSVVVEIPTSSTGMPPR